jgi:hypothetical protein
MYSYSILKQPLEKIMKDQFVMSLSKVDSNVIKLVVVLVSLTLFVLGAGAPASDGGIGG